MAKPTEQDLHHAQGLLEELASRYDRHNNPNGWPDVLTLLDLMVWADTELDHAKRAAVYGPGGPRSPEGGGTIGGQTIGRGGHSRPVEARLDFGTDTRPRLRPELADPLVRALKQFRASINTSLGQLTDQLGDQAKDIARWPTRTQETG